MAAKIQVTANEWHLERKKLCETKVMNVFQENIITGRNVARAEIALFFFFDIRFFVWSIFNGNHSAKRKKSMPEICPINLATMLPKNGHQPINL